MIMENLRFALDPEGSVATLAAHMTDDGDYYVIIEVQPAGGEVYRYDSRELPLIKIDTKFDEEDLPMILYACQAALMEGWRYVLARSIDMVAASGTDTRLQ